jgi:hypothetical protein
MFIKDKPVISSERMLHENYDRKDLVGKVSDRDPQGAWRQDELIGGKPPVAK